jgi:hypothetical protein
MAPEAGLLMDQELENDLDSEFRSDHAPLKLRDAELRTDHPPERLAKSPPPTLQADPKVDADSLRTVHSEARDPDVRLRTDQDPDRRPAAPLGGAASAAKSSSSMGGAG